VAKRFLLHAKERYRPDVLRPLAVQLAAAIEATGLLARVDVVVPVPSTLAARLRRGFEPARELAREVALAEEVAFRPRTLRRRRLSGRSRGWAPRTAGSELGTRSSSASVYRGFACFSSTT
jgi:predicted amidophosphoribosyltransferase